MKNKSKNLLACVIYKGVEPYISNLLKSVSLQSSNDFDLLIFNDGVSDSSELSNYKSNIIEIKSESLQTPPIVRNKCIEFAKTNHYSSIIFCDADDLLSSNYVEEILYALNTYDFAFCDLHPFRFDISEKSSAFLSSFIPSNGIFLNDIIDRNLIGLGHSGMRVESIKEIQLPHELVAVDWYLFSVMILKGLIGNFIARPLVHYRQSSLNTVGLVKRVSKKSVLHGINVKKLHYRAMLSYCSQNNILEKNIYLQKYEEIKELDNYLLNPENLNKYISIINNNLSSIFRGWWSEILTLCEFKKYECILR